MNNNEDNSRFILNIWYFMPNTQNEANNLINFLKKNQNITLELNTSQNGVLDNQIFSKYNTTEEFGAFVISRGIDIYRVIYDNSIQSNLPMFRVVKNN